MSELKPAEKRLQRAINKAMEDDEFDDTILEAAQARQIKQLRVGTERLRETLLTRIDQLKAELDGSRHRNNDLSKVSCEQAIKIKQLKADLAAKDKLLKELISEIWFVLSGGDDPTDVCTECGIAGYGALRTKTKEAEQALKGR